MLLQCHLRCFRILPIKGMDALAAFTEEALARTNREGRLKRDRRRKSPTVTSNKPSRHRKDLSSLRGLYRRVADRLDVDPSYVSRVARSERHSKLVSDALRHELDKIMKHWM